MNRNMARSPVLAAIWSGASSMAALFVAGAAKQKRRAQAGGHHDQSAGRDQKAACAGGHTVGRGRIQGDERGNAEHGDAVKAVERVHESEFLAPEQLQVERRVIGRQFVPEEEVAGEHRGQGGATAVVRVA